MTADYELVRLANGVFSVRARAEGETFHPVVGPVEEARELYVEQLHLPQRIGDAGREFVIWDIGLGAAANVLTVIEAASKKTGTVRIVSFDHKLEPLEFAVKHAHDLGYLGGFVPDLERLLERGEIQFRHGELEIQWQVHVADFPSLLSSESATQWPKPDAILFDAYSPARNPAMWTLPLFTRIYELLDPTRPCAMPTYSRSTMLRVTLLLAGFFVGAGRAIAEKEETTIAANSLSLIEKPLPVEWLQRVRRSTCAEPLKAPIYTRDPLSEGSWEKLLTHPQFAGTATLQRGADRI